MVPSSLADFVKKKAAEQRVPAHLIPYRLAFPQRTIPFANGRAAPVNMCLRGVRHLDIVQRNMSKRRRRQPCYGTLPKSSAANMSRLSGLPSPITIAWCFSIMWAVASPSFRPTTPGYGSFRKDMRRPYRHLPRTRNSSRRRCRTFGQRDDRRYSFAQSTRHF